MSKDTKLDTEKSDQASSDRSNRRVGVFFTCLLCGRDKFTRAGQPHRCQGGFRKRFKKEAERRGIENCFVPTPND